ncbi:MAG: hypothetical protein KatS3mg076_0146 [Candidatus Binatia bacterium]|nr:MAG: hypothetical protein KatS3mg076_0146 [Candidatus Binatia bacterium]
MPEFGIDARTLGELLVVVLFCGSTACWLLRLDDTLLLVLLSGTAGLYLEPRLRLDVGPLLFDHSLLACTAGAVATAFLLGLALSLLQVWILPRYRHLLG